MLFGNKLKRKMLHGMHEELVDKLARDGSVEIDFTGKFVWDGEAVTFKANPQLNQAVKQAEKKQ